MKTADKLILKTYLGPMVLTFFIVMFVLVLQFMWRYIDEVVGKGIGLDTVIELMMYAALSLIPMGLPLATLLAAIMSMGNLGENYELLALKSAGVSLPRIIRPLVIVVFIISVGSFFIADRVTPYATKKMFTLIFDIRQQKQSMDFKDGIFFNGFDNMSIRVGHQDKKTKLLTDVLIYDNRSPEGKMTTTVADSGYITMSDNRKFLLVTLFNGETYETGRTMDWYEKNSLQHFIFDAQNLVIDVPGFDFERSDASLYNNNSQAQNLYELTVGIDSLERESEKLSNASYGPLINSYLFPRDTSVLNSNDSLVNLRKTRHQLLVSDSIGSLKLDQKKALYELAANNSRSSRSFYQFDESASKESLNQLYKFRVEWHKKISLPVSIMIFFLIGAPLGAIIRRGGLGMPIVVSVSFFVIYYIITISGEKMAKEGTWSAFSGMWIATFILLPISVYLTYKATNDSNLLNSEWYSNKIKAISNFTKKIWHKKKAS